MLRCAALAALGAVVWTLCTLVFFNGYTDDFYLRVSSPRQASLVVGTSRAAQGIVPEELDARALGFGGPLYNFAFTSANSRYGKVYFDVIERKLAPAPGGARGLFLLEVSPLALSIDKGTAGSLPEEKTFLAKLHLLSTSPNPEYPLYVPERGYDIIDRSVRRLTGKTRLLLHADGWLEVTPDTDPQRFATQLQHKLVDYRKAFAASEPSELRREYLRRTLALFARHGSAVLVRMPIHPELAALEQAYMPGFDAEMASLAREQHARYIDLSDLNASVATTDGNHLRRDSARQVTRELRSRLQTQPTISAR
jgi:hypothetical protein